MTGRHKPERMCVACRQMLEQETLIQKKRSAAEAHIFAEAPNV